LVTLELLCLRIPGVALVVLISENQSNLRLRHRLAKNRGLFRN